MDENVRAGAVVANVLAMTGARAAGLWTIAGQYLVQGAFSACPDMPEEVAREFAAATRSVPISEVSLGIVSAVRSGEPFVSRAVELPADSGSGRWLRAFGAERSIAVPLVNSLGQVAAVLSVAVPPGPEPDQSIADRVRAVGLQWLAT